MQPSRGRSLLRIYDVHNSSDSVQATMTAQTTAIPAAPGARARSRRAAGEKKEVVHNHCHDGSCSSGYGMQHPCRPNANGNAASKGCSAFQNPPNLFLLTRRILILMSAVCVAPFLVCCAVFGPPVLDQRLPFLQELPANPKRASAMLHSESNVCYDLLLLVGLDTWLRTNSKYPMLILHSVPLPPRVEELVRVNADKLIPRKVVSIESSSVMKKRVKSAATKLAVWAQSDYDQIVYWDSDHIFVENSDGIFEAPDDGGQELLYAVPYEKYCNKPILMDRLQTRGQCIFQSNNFLVRPNPHVYTKLLNLFRHKFWIMSFHQYLKTADQGFLNAALRGRWKQMDSQKVGRAKHVKVWKALSRLKGWGVTEEDYTVASDAVKRLNLQDELDRCKVSREYH